MSILTSHFYHKTITLYHGIFGSVFDSIKIVRSDGKVVKVPIAVASKEKNNTANDSDRRGKSTTFNLRLPRMAFMMVGMEKDEARQTNKNNKLFDLQPVDPLIKGYQYNSVPYNFTFELRVKTKYYDDMLQIIEQICASFSNEIQIVVKDNPDLNIDSQVILQMLDVSPANEFEGTFEEAQSIETTFNFELKGWLYKKTNTQGVIQKIIIDYKDLKTEELLHQQVIPDEI